VPTPMLVVALAEDVLVLLLAEGGAVEAVGRADCRIAQNDFLLEESPKLAAR
jgi:hypothetical protein